MNDRSSARLGIALFVVYVICLAALVAMVSRAHAGELYAQTGVAYLVPHGACHDAAGTATWCRYDATVQSRALAHVEVGYTVARGRFSADLYARHESQPSLRDYGCNQLGIAVRVRLWGSP